MLRPNKSQRIEISKIPVVSCVQLSCNIIQHLRFPSVPPPQYSRSPKLQSLQLASFWPIPPWTMHWRSYGASPSALDSSSSIGAKDSSNHWAWRALHPLYYSHLATLRFIWLRDRLEILISILRNTVECHPYKALRWYSAWLLIMWSRVRSPQWVLFQQQSVEHWI